MEDVARSVVAALQDRALPLIERELNRPVTSPSYVIVEVGSGPPGTYINDAGEVVYYQAGAKRLWPVPEGSETANSTTGDSPDLGTAPHTWRFNDAPTVHPYPRRSTIANPDITRFTAVFDGTRRHALSDDPAQTVCGVPAAGFKKLSALYTLTHPLSCQRCQDAIQST